MVNYESVAKSIFEHYKVRRHGRHYKCGTPYGLYPDPLSPLRTLSLSSSLSCLWLTHFTFHLQPKSFADHVIDKQMFLSFLEEKGVIGKPLCRTL